MKTISKRIVSDAFLRCYIMCIILLFGSCSLLNDLKPLQKEIKLLRTNGSVSLMADESDQWVSFEQGASRLNITSLKTLTDGAVFGIIDHGDTVGKIWLRGKTQINLFQNDKGTMYIEFLKGDARISMFTSSQKVMLKDSNKKLQQNLTKSDLLFHRLTSDSPLEIVPTSKKPEWANWCLDIELNPEPVGLGTLTAQNETGDKVHLELRRVTVDAVQEGDVVSNRVEQVFYNNSDRQLEGTFRFYLPEGASVTGLAMEINGKLMEGELVEKEKAKKIYQKIVDSMRDPAILEWEQGQQFKLRVFPIEPNSEKRLVLRFLTPLKRQFNDYEYEYATEAADMQRTIDHFKLTFNGNTIVDTTNFTAGERIIVNIPKENYPEPVGKETIQDKGTYTRLTIKPDFDSITKRKYQNADGQQILVLFDTSRSALESYKLAVESVVILLQKLRPNDRFKIIASDIYSYESSPSFASPSETEIKNAVTFLQNISPDGASDFTLAFRAVGQNLENKKNTQVVYIGNGVPTWGETDHIKLRELAVTNLNDSSFHGLVIGKGASSDLINDIAGKTGGRVLKSRSLKEISKFALQVSLPDTLRIRDVAIVGPDSADIFPKKVTTLFEGDELTCLFYTPPDTPEVTTLTLTGNVEGRPFSETLSCKNGVNQKYLAHRWASEKLAHMTAEGAKKEAIVELSIDHGVLSRYTAFLVLESDEAYKKHGIERRKKEEQEREARISGKNLESTSADQAEMSPNSLQAGDPVLTIPAPSDAKSVTVILPFGDSKEAEYDPTIEKWTTRFLVPLDTPDGVYQIYIRITHDNDSVELFTVSYRVDSSAPDINLKFEPVPDREGVWVFRITQKKTLVPMLTEDSDKAGIVVIHHDLNRVEIKLPDDRILRLKRNFETNEFTAFWRPGKFIDVPFDVSVIAFDNALNNSEEIITINPFEANE